ncbi:putative phage abortive infection protein [Lysinibacillus fusiformis]|uniref:putative phage abortive infection protein n=1 Tax=Lysinibacillus fusiformis TaxID=28031 RepID=UPI0030168CA2
MNANQKDKKAWYKKWENYLIIFGFIIVVVAILTPFSIIYFNGYEYSHKSFEKLGTVGDFFGGTTVGLLSLASLMFVTAAMFMQKEELELQRKEVTATRKEYKITNRTMKKQSFDSTFFNMIDLHQSILNQVNFKEDKGRKAFKSLYIKLEKSISSEKNNIFWEWFYDDYYSQEKRIELINEVLTNTDKRNDLIILLNNEIKSAERNLENDLHRERIILLKGILDSLQMSSYILDNVTSILGCVNSKYLFHVFNINELIDEKIDVKFLKEDFFKKMPSYYKRKIYEKFYSENESIIGHYYRNLYRIVKYIQEYDFSDNGMMDEKINLIEKKEYRGILRAQLSSYELLMLFYNVCYSEKGEKFKKILESTNFFDNHIVEEDFIWENDTEELEFFK